MLRGLSRRVRTGFPVRSRVLPEFGYKVRPTNEADVVSQVGKILRGLVRDQRRAPSGECELMWEPVVRCGWPRPLQWLVASGILLWHREKIGSLIGSEVGV